jgi:hypothetical protein
MPGRGGKHRLQQLLHPNIGCEKCGTKSLVRQESREQTLFALRELNPEIALLLVTTKVIQINSTLIRRSSFDFADNLWRFS